MQKLIRFGHGTADSFTGTRPPCFLALVNAHPMRFSVAGADAVVLGSLAYKPEDVAAAVAQIRRDLDEIEAEATKHFG